MIIYGENNPYVYIVIVNPQVTLPYHRFQVLFLSEVFGKVFGSNEEGFEEIKLIVYCNILQYTTHHF